jgi:hypothetical protein
LLVPLSYSGPTISHTHYHNLWTAVIRHFRCSWLTETGTIVRNFGRKQYNSTAGTPWLSWEWSVQERWDGLNTRHVFSNQFVITNHETSKLPISRLLHLRIDTVPGQMLLLLEYRWNADVYSGCEVDTVMT